MIKKEYAPQSTSQGMQFPMSKFIERMELKEMNGDTKKNTDSF